MKMKNSSILHKNLCVSLFVAEQWACMMYMKNHRKTVSEFYIDLRDNYMSSIFIDATVQGVERIERFPINILND